MVDSNGLDPTVCFVCSEIEVQCERCTFKGPCKDYAPCAGYNDTRCPECGSTRNLHNRIYMRKSHTGEM